MATGVTWRLGSQYGLIAAAAPGILTDTLAHLHASAGAQRAAAARLVVAAARTADAVAYKFGAHDLSARLIDVMRWAAEQAADPDIRAAGEPAEHLNEDVYLGTAFGPSSVRIHEVSVAVSLGGDHLSAALDVARGWKPPEDLPAERRSGFYIEVCRAHLWDGKPDAAFEALKAARRLAPQHVREHPWARDDVETIRRLKRADAETLTSFAEWIGAV